jgi:hypothetical protein
MERRLIKNHKLLSQIVANDIYVLNKPLVLAATIHNAKKSRLIYGNHPKE